MKKTILSALLSLSLHAASTSSRIELRHIEPKGVGYDQGYTTLEAFLIHSRLADNQYVPFVDLRGHVFDNGKLAANLGLGMRMRGEGVWGVNAYYDYRNDHSTFHQVGAGVEYLGKIWDFRLNGYLPFGAKNHYYSSLKFHKFKNHFLYLTRKGEFSMKGLNAEVGALIKRFKSADIYAAAGPYVFGYKGVNAWGGEARVVLNAWDWLRLQVNSSYDAVFKTVVQGEVAFVWNFGSKKEESRCNHVRSCYERLYRPVERNEIIVLKKTRKQTRAINPETGEAYFFWFVDNTSHSQGTFESPFPRLADAETASSANQIIYVFPGDGTETGMDTGIALKFGQQLLGAGISHNLAAQVPVVIPPLASGFPKITFPTATGTQAPVSMTEGHNVVSGILARGGSAAGVREAVRIRGGLDYLIENNIIQISNDGNGISTGDDFGQITIRNNTIVGLDLTETWGVFTSMSSPPTGTQSVLIEGNLFRGNDASSGLNVGTNLVAQTSGASSTLNYTVQNNTSNSQTNTAGGHASGIWIRNTGPLTINATIQGNQVTIPTTITTPDGGIVVRVEAPATGRLSASLHQNTSTTTAPTPGYRFVNTSGNPSLLNLDFGADNAGTVSGP